MIEAGLNGSFSRTTSPLPSLRVLTPASLFDHSKAVTRFKKSKLRRFLFSPFFFFLLLLLLRSRARALLGELEDFQASDQKCEREHVCFLFNASQISRCKLDSVGNHHGRSAQGPTSAYALSDRWVVIVNTLRHNCAHIAVRL
jgi:hypothetical protein